MCSWDIARFELSKTGAKEVLYTGAGPGLKTKKSVFFRRNSSFHEKWYVSDSTDAKEVLHRGVGQVYKVWKRRFCRNNSFHELSCTHKIMHVSSSLKVVQKRICTGVQDECKKLTKIVFFVEIAHFMKFRVLMRYCTFQTS